MQEKKNDSKFTFSDRFWWWGSNILGFIASLVLLLAVIISLPFKHYGSKRMRYIVRILLLGVFMLSVIGAYLYFIPNQKTTFGVETKYIMIHRGETVYDISYKLEEAGAISSEFNFLLFSKLFGHSRRLKAGRYAIEPGYSISDIFQILITGAATPFNATIREGLTVSETAEILSNTLSFTAAEFTKVCHNRLWLDSLGIETDDIEGYLFPDTYNFFFDESPESVARKMTDQFYANLPDSFEIKAKRLGIDFYEAVTIASLVEAEAMLDEERPTISAVYHKRLKIRMRLQCDPTVIYALGGLDRPLYKRDLQYDSPYNTYKYYGLPPGPICSPGKASLEAAVKPADVDFLYFVARGDGSHVFSRTNRDHVNAKNKIKRDKRNGIFN